MTRSEAFIEKSWRTTGLAQLLVARLRDDGRTDIAFFLVDLWCLGIKDAFLHDDATEAEFRALITERIPEADRERLHPACAKKLLDGAIAYAERLGFHPYADEDMAAAFAPLLVRATQIMKDRVVIACFFLFCIHIFKTVYIGLHRLHNACRYRF